MNITLATLKFVQHIKDIILTDLVVCEIAHRSSFWCDELLKCYRHM